MQIFRIDGPVYTALNIISDFLILSVLYVVCCIPVLTIGASTTALYYASQKMINQEGHPVRNFFKSFRDNFKQSTLIWLPSIIFFGIMILNIIFVTPNLETNTISQIIFILNATLLLACGFVYALVFPLLSRFDNTIIHTLINSFIITARYLPWALLAAIVNYLPLILVLVFPLFSIYILVFSLFFGFALCVYISAYIYEKKIFKHFIS